MSEMHREKRSLFGRLAAELVVIVLGVLIALWADGWVAERSDRRVEASRITALRQNVTATRARLDQALEEATSAREALTATARWNDASDVAGHAHLVGAGLLYGPVFTPELNVYMDLKSSGDLALLRSDDLREALARMDATFEELALLTADMVMVQQLNIDPVMIEEFDLGPIVGPWVGLDDLTEAPATPDFDIRVFRNLSLFKRTRRSSGPSTRPAIAATSTPVSR
ncbi:MAG: hypothetical protein P8049_12840 [Gemmatimonadota bacterium]